MALGILTRVGLVLLLGLVSAAAQEPVETRGAWRLVADGTDFALRTPAVAAPDSTLSLYCRKSQQQYAFELKSPAEMLAERFHMDEDLLERLNRGKKLDQAGTTITVANVSVKPAALDTKIGKIEVDKQRKLVRALSTDGRPIAVYPASIGSEEKPAPSGTLKVTRIARNPNYTYNPDYKFRGVKAKEEFKIAPGPNNPVGLVWIALNQKGYGIHGTPDPEKVGKAYSHGCVRLTNWDALALAAMVKKGTPVAFID
jgi:lipoprotein-anchoring transpeptidase ErfK/SrfK